MISMQVGRMFLVVLTIKQDVKSSSLVDKTISNYKLLLGRTKFKLPTFRNHLYQLKPTTTFFLWKLVTNFGFLSTLKSRVYGFHRLPTFLNPI
jgi:hypothetical protein